MTKEQFEKYKKILIAIILTAFAVDKTLMYINGRNFEDKIVFYELEASSVDDVSKDTKKFTENTDSENISNNVTDIDKSMSIINDVPSEGDGNLININTASAEELQKLYRIGPALSQRIIDYRNNYGNFEVIEEIKEVSGIGDATFEKIKDYIKVK